MNLQHNKSKKDVFYPQEHCRKYELDWLGIGFEILGFIRLTGLAILYWL